MAIFHSSFNRLRWAFRFNLWRAREFGDLVNLFACVDDHGMLRMIFLIFFFWIIDLLQLEADERIEKVSFTAFIRFKQGCHNR